MNHVIIAKKVKAKGITCLGSDDIIIDYNYWIMVYEYGEESYVNRNLFDTDQYIISVRCPEKYCCSKESGCDLIKDSRKLCATNRDPNKYLCGKCIDNYSEVFGTTNCGKCDRNYYERLLLPIFTDFMDTFSFIKRANAMTYKKMAVDVAVNCKK